MSALRWGNFQHTLFKPTQHNKVAKQNIKYMTEESVSYYWNMCVNETTPKSQKEVVAEKRILQHDHDQQGAYTTIRFVNWSYTRSLRMKQVLRALYEICYIMKCF